MDTDKLAKTLQAQCCECGSHDVELKAWVNQKTGVIQYADIIEDDDVWCNNCENHVNVDWVDLSEEDLEN